MENQFVITGTIKSILAPEEIGTHTKYPLVIVYGPKKTEVAIDFWNDKGDALAKLTEGQEVAVQVMVKSRESKGRWYTSLSADSIAKA